MPKIVKAARSVQSSVVYSSGDLVPYWTSPDGNIARLYHGHVLDVLKKMPTGSVQCVVTSPPYWALRDYGTATWSGGDSNCLHIERTAEQCHKSSTLGPKGIGHPVTNAAYQALVRQFARKCKLCGAIRIDKQIGSEETVEEFLAVMVELFREVRRVLRDDGTLWLNLGDTYAGTGVCGDGSPVGAVEYRATDRQKQSDMNRKSSLPAGNIVAVPWRTALALQADGWVLRQDIVWHKRSPMPESVRNRCTKAHEYIFLMTKSDKYFYDCEAIREKTGRETDIEDYRKAMETSWSSGGLEKGAGGCKPPEKVGFTNPGGRNKRSVWSIAAQGYPGAHFATFPPKMVEPCLLAGTSAYGACTTCGSPWERVVNLAAIANGDRETPPGQAPHANARNADKKLYDRSKTRNRNNSSGVLSGDTEIRQSTTIGWRKTCQCLTNEVRPCIVLDPFIGSGTTIQVCIERGRWGWGIDLSETYLKENAIPRITAAKYTASSDVNLFPIIPVKATPMPIKKIQFSS